MEVRKLLIEEMPQAVSMSKYVFNNVVRANMRNLDMVKAFDDYMDVSSLQSQVLEGNLHVWGAFEDGVLCGVGGMVIVGHITMLYVHPQYQRRGIGTAVLEEMRQYAKNFFGIKQPTINVIPTWSVGFFAKQGFEQLDPTQNIVSPYISMRGKAPSAVTYRKKEIPSKVMLASIFATIGGGCVFVFGYILYFCLFVS